MKIDYQNLERKIKINFKNKNLLIKSLTHKSFNKEENNEKVEFLGDRVLALVMAKKLLEIYPNEKEGILDKKFASLVNKRTCLEISKKLQLQKYILTLNSRNDKNTIEDKILADSCEALIGSIYLDKGYTVAEKTILSLWSEQIKQSVITQVDAKTKLQELAKSLDILNITFLESMPKNDVPDVLSLMDVSLVPLKKSDLFKTVIPSKIFENAAMQTPILLGVEGESANIINEYGAGLCFEPENKTSFIKNLTILKENKEVYFSCQNGCLNLAKAFDRRKMADEMRKYILEIL